MEIERGCEKTLARKKDAYKEMCKSGTEAIKARYKNMKNRAKKVVAKAMNQEAERELKELSEHPNKVFKLVKSIKKDGNDVERGRCMRDTVAMVGYISVKKIKGKSRKSTWKEL